MSDALLTGELLPCPFCGAANINDTTEPAMDPFCWVCPDCVSCGPVGATLDEATAAWNRRADSALAQAGTAPEPVAWRVKGGFEEWLFFTNEIAARKVASFRSEVLVQPLYAYPAAAVTAREARLEAALRFYANPETYFAIGFMADAPCGDFIDDFDEQEIAGQFGKYPRPGKRARAALTPEAPK